MTVGSGTVNVNKRKEQPGLVVLIQCIGVVVGLWMHSSYVSTSLHESVTNEVWEQLEEFAADLALSAPGGKPASTIQNAPVRGEIGCVLIDDARRVTATSPHTHQDAAFKGGATLTWESAGRPGTGWKHFHRVQVDGATGSYLALIRTLAGGGQRLLVYVPVAVRDQHAATLMKPVWPITAITLAWIGTVLALTTFMMSNRRTKAKARSDSTVLSTHVRQARSLVRTRDAVIFGLAKLADSRDTDTGEHLDRISTYSTILATALSQDPDYSDRIDAEFVRLIGISSALHDIGKVGIEDRILLKPGSLTDEERTRMQEHTTIGGECLREIEQRLGTSNFLQMAREIAYAHHEKWNGCGYPYGLSAEEIPLAARIVAIADAYDALSSRRVYKPAIPHAHCAEIIRTDAGTHFDPGIVAVWNTVEARFQAISEQYVAEDVESSISLDVVFPEPRQDTPVDTPPDEVDQPMAAPTAPVVDAPLSDIGRTTDTRG